MVLQTDHISLHTDVYEYVTEVGHTDWFKYTSL